MIIVVFHSCNLPILLLDDHTFKSFKDRKAGPSNATAAPSTWNLHGCLGIPKKSFGAWRHGLLLTTKKRHQLWGIYWVEAEWCHFYGDIKLLIHFDPSKNSKFNIYIGHHSKIIPELPEGVQEQTLATHNEETRFFLCGFAYILDSYIICILFSIYKCFL